MLHTNVIRWLGATAMVLGMAGGISAAETPVESVGLLKNVSGVVTIERVGGSVRATAGAPLFVSDRIEAASGAAAGIVFKDGTLLTVGPATRIQVRDYVFEPKDARYAFDVYLDKGSAIYASGRIGKLAPDAVRLESPTATVGVRGTRFIIQAD
ncbi:MAG: FecR family protein [Rubrivivax sp.]